MWTRELTRSSRMHWTNSCHNSTPEVNATSVCYRFSSLFVLSPGAFHSPHVSTAAWPNIYAIAIAAIGKVIFTAPVADARSFRGIQTEGTHHADPIHP